MWGYGPYGMGGYGHGWEWMGGMMLFGGIFWVILLVLGVIAVMWLVRGSWHGGNRPGSDRGPAGLDILKERYARGEVGRDEYLQKERDILGHVGND